MPANAQNREAAEISLLLRGEPESLRTWLERHDARRVALYVSVIAIGAGPFGATMGWWRDPMNGLFVAIKFPLIILLTALGNALLNAMLAPLLGLNITLRQSVMAVFMSFAITAAVLGAFSPLLGFLVWNAPPMSLDVKSTPTYGFIKLTCVAMIAFAGIVGNVRLFQLLAQLGGSRAVARRVLFAWLAVNLFLGSQLTWIARPFIGAPGLPVAFLREQAFRGNFYENVFVTVMEFLRPD
jgi:hypothetical protein